jgi:hypothetical protein
VDYFGTINSLYLVRPEQPKSIEIHPKGRTIFRQLKATCQNSIPMQELDRVSHSLISCDFK